MPVSGKERNMQILKFKYDFGRVNGMYVTKDIIMFRTDRALRPFHRRDACDIYKLG